VLTTGGRTEQAAMQLFAELPEEAFIQMGDFVGAAMRHAVAARVPRAVIVGMIGKLSKMAEGKTHTHARQSEVNMEFLAGLAAGSGASAELLTAIRGGNTGRQVLDLCRAHGLPGIATAVCRAATERLSAYVENRLEVCTCLVDFDGTLLARYPETVLVALATNSETK
jgi:cobalt-precorrin-5B (C1)-methyltransferase